MDSLTALKKFIEKYEDSDLINPTDDTGMCAYTKNDEPEQLDRTADHCFVGQFLYENDLPIPEENLPWFDYDDDVRYSTLSPEVHDILSEAQLVADKLAPWSDVISYLRSKFVNALQ